MTAQLVFSVTVKVIRTRKADTQLTDTTELSIMVMGVKEW